MALSIPGRSTLLEALSGAPYPLRQGLLGAGYLLSRRRLPNLPYLAAGVARDLPRAWRPLVPQPEDALERPDGFCGLAGSIGVPELLQGYGRGMFVMSHIGPLKWWAPAHRMVLFFDEARVEKTTRRLLKGHRFRVTFDQSFDAVLLACSAPRPGRTPLTWITPRIRRLFHDAHVAGHAHSVEVWQDDDLVGGAYGLAVGTAFFTESQFHTARDASKVGFAVLNRHLQAWGFALNDGKHPTPYLVASGCRPLTRAEFSAATRACAAEPGRPGRWTVDPDLLSADWEPAQAAGVRMRDVLPEGSSCPWTAQEMLDTRRSNAW